MPQVTFNTPQGFVPENQPHDFRRDQPRLSAPVNMVEVVKVELDDFAEGNERRGECAYGKAVGITEDGTRVVLWDGNQWLYRQYRARTARTLHCPSDHKDGLRVRSVWCRISN